MTIKIDQEALLTVLSRPPSHPPCHLQRSGDDLLAYDGEELVDVTCEKRPLDLVLNENFVPLRSSQYELYDCESFDDDCTATTASSSDSSLEEKSVTFAEPFVTDVWTRPRTLRKDISKLFYSVDETTRFRQEYRLERKVLAELDLDPATQDDGELSALLADGPASTGRHLISRVVVLHNDKLETFHNESSSPCKPLTSDDDDAFFDSDSFWSGSITWY